jgi:hypothetical protein
MPSAGWSLEKNRPVPDCRRVTSTTTFSPGDVWVDLLPSEAEGVEHAGPVLPFHLRALTWLSPEDGWREGVVVFRFVQHAPEAPPAEAAALSCSPLPTHPRGSPFPRTAKYSGERLGERHVARSSRGGPWSPTPEVVAVTRRGALGIECLHGERDSRKRLALAAGRRGCHREAGAFQLTARATPACLIVPAAAGLVVLGLAAPALTVTLLSARFPSASPCTGGAPGSEPPRRGERSLQVAE